MVDDQGNRQPRKYFFILCEVAAIELHLNVPAKAGDPRCHRFQRFQRQHAAGKKMVADAANPRAREPIELGIGCVGVDDRDRSRALA